MGRRPSLSRMVTPIAVQFFDQMGREKCFLNGRGAQRANSSTIRLSKSSVSSRTKIRSRGANNASSQQNLVQYDCTPNGNAKIKSIQLSDLLKLFCAFWSLFIAEVAAHSSRWGPDDSSLQIEKANFYFPFTPSFSKTRHNIKYHHLPLPNFCATKFQRFRVSEHETMVTHTYVINRLINCSSIHTVF